MQWELCALVPSGGLEFRSPESCVNAPSTRQYVAVVLSLAY